MVSLDVLYAENIVKSAFFSMIQKYALGVKVGELYRLASRPTAHVQS